MPLQPKGSLPSQLTILWANAPDSINLIERQITIPQPGEIRKALEQVSRLPLLMPLQFSQPRSLKVTSILPRQIPMTEFNQRK
ncbi:MAG: hypothetical protein OXC62_03700 [Aestuariivita sp.]|nr:hypothetical protein [Aestuariivita sp.]